MLREQIRNIDTSDRALRTFGLLIGGILMALGAVLLWRHKPAGPWLAGPGLLLVLLGAAAPRGLKHIYIVWMSLALVLGLGVSTVLLTLFYYLGVTAIGLIARCVGKDFLSQKWDRKASSYWIARPRTAPRPPADYERQF